MRLNRSSFLLILTILLFSSILYPQAYNSPESAVYDASNDRYLVSNLDGNIITVPRTNTSNLSFFSTGVSTSVRGLTIFGNNLFAATTSNNGVTQDFLVFDLSTGNVTKTINILEGNFINDVTVNDDGTKAWVSDNNNIYEIDVANSTYIILLANANANGLFFDSTNNRLLFTDDRPATSSAISAIDLGTNNISILIANPNFFWLDGLTVDNQGDYYVSYWGSDLTINNNGVVKYNSDFTNMNILPYFNDGNAGYADLFYDIANDVLVVPEMTNNVVQFVQPNNLVNTENENGIPSNISLHQNFPNPFNPTTTIHYELDLENNVNVTVYDLLGSEIVQLVNRIEQPGVKNVIWNGKDSEGKLVNGGVYLYKLTVGNYTETRKMVFLK